MHADGICLIDGFLKEANGRKEEMNWTERKEPLEGMVKGSRLKQGNVMNDGIKNVPEPK